MKRFSASFKSRHVSFHIVTALFVFGSVLFGVVYFLNSVSAAGCSFASTEATNSFNVAANWSCGHVPIAGDSVTIPAATTTNMLSGPVTVSGVTISGTLNIGSQRLNANSLIVNSGGVATSTSGTLTVSGSGTTTNSGSIGTNSGNFLFSGNVQNNGTFDISGGNVTTTLNSTFTNAGTINGGTGSLAIAKGLVDSSGTFNAQRGTVRTFDDGHVWVMNGNLANVSKIDPASGSVLATTTVGSSPRQIAFDGIYLWVTNFSSNNVSKIDPTTNSVVATTTVGTNPLAIIFGGGFIWVANSGSSNVSKIDPTTNAVVATTTVGVTPLGVAFDGSSIWVTNQTSGNVSKIDPSTNAVVATTTVGANPRPITFGGGFIWVMNISPRTIYKIDPATNAVVATMQAGTGSSFNIQFFEGYLWVANFTTGSVSKIDITTNAVVVTTAVGVNPTGMVFDGSYLWVVNQTSENVSKIDFSTNAVVATTTLETGSNPQTGGIFSGSTVPINISLPGYVYNNVQIFNFHSDTISFAASSTILGTFNLISNNVSQVRSGSTLAISTSTLTAVGLITNTGTITEGAGGKIVHTAESVKLTDSSGVEASSYSTATGAPAPVVYVTVQDSNRNLLGSTIETMTVTVTLDATAGSDSETMTLTETSVSSGIFRNLAALAIIPATAISTPENGQFELVATGIGTLTYTDNQDAADVGTDTITFSKTAASTNSNTGGGGGGSTSPGSSGIQPSGFAPIPSGTGTQTEPTPIQAEFIDPNNLPLLLATFGLTENPTLHIASLSLVRSDAKSFGLTLTSAQETTMCNFIVYGISEATIKFGSGERRAILRDYLDTMRRSDVVWSDIQRMATGRIMIVRNLPEEQKRVAIILPVFLKIFGHIPNFQDATENLSWNTMQYRLRFPRNLTLEAMGIQSYRTLFLKIPVTPFEWSIVRVLGYIRR